MKRKYGGLGKILLVFGAFCALLVSCARCSLGGPGTPEEVTIMSYNVQNLFDAVDNGTEYREFDPGESEWTADLYYMRMFNLAEVVAAAVDGGPDVLVLQEVENSAVVEVLWTDILKRYRYRHAAVTDTPDSAVQLAVLSRYPILRSRSHGISLGGAVYRDILEVSLRVGNAELILFNNHWKSKYGGAEETEPVRIMAAEVLRKRMGEIAASRPGADMAVLGDLNENADEAVRVGGAYPTALRQVEMEGSGAPAAADLRGLAVTGDSSRVSFEGDRGGDLILYSPWLDPGRPADGPEGSYYYDGGWETIDHALLSAGFFDETGFSYGGFRPVAEDFILTHRGHPKRWMTSSLSGYSDHLPLVLVLSVEEE
ncbi:MAG: endonuclease/exonuclease/phosphatase family protein [Spirochaetia bacterium]